MDQHFNLLGLLLDDGLSMVEAVGKLVTEAGWKLRTLLRTRRFYTDADLVILYKAHLLSFLEYRTPAIYHATRDVLARLDAVQSRFLTNAGVSKVDALVHFHLAPLSVRRDIAWSYTSSCSWQRTPSLPEALSSCFSVLAQNR